MTKISLRNSVILAGLALRATAVMAQAPMLDHQFASAAWIDAQWPTFKSGGPTSALLLNPGLRLALNRDATISLVAEVPFMRATPPSQVLLAQARTLTGNPYLGVRWTRGSRWIDLGGRLPLAKPDAASAGYPDSAGVFGDFDRHEAYMPDLASATIGITQSSFAGRGFGTRVNLSGNFEIPVRNRTGHTVVTAKAGAMLGLVVPRVALLAGVTINARLGSNANVYSQSVNEQAEIGAILRLPWVRPSVSIRIPLSNDISNVTSAVLQAGLVVRLP